MEDLRIESVPSELVRDYITRAAQLATLVSVEALSVSPERASIRTLTDDPGRELLGAQNISRNGLPDFWHTQRAVTAEMLDAPHPHLSSDVLGEFSTFVGKLAMPLHQVFARIQYSAREQRDVPFLGVMAACDVSDHRQIFKYVSTIEHLTGRKLNLMLESKFALSDGSIVRIQPAPVEDGRFR